MSLNKFGLTNTLFEVINKNCEDSTDAIIAKYLIGNLENLENITIYDVAEACYTNRSTVRRFCISIGIGNFLDLKKEQLPRDFFAKDMTKKINYEDLLVEEVQKMALDISGCSKAYKEELTNKIMASNICTFLISDIYNGACCSFQTDMIFKNKLIRIVQGNYTNDEVLKALTSNDLVIVISVSGRWAREAVPFISNRDYCAILLTTIHNEFEEYYDKVYYLSSSDKAQERNIYHEFAVQYLLKIILNNIA